MLSLFLWTSACVVKQRAVTLEIKIHLLWKRRLNQKSLRAQENKTVLFLKSR